MRKLLEQYAEERDVSFLFADGFDDAILGILPGEHCQVIYSQEKCIEILVEQGMSCDEAYEFFFFNIAGACMGPSTPLFIETLDDWDD